MTLPGGSSGQQGQWSPNLEVGTAEAIGWRTAPVRGLGVAVVPVPRAGSPEAVPGPVAHLEILAPAR
jgi:hypothetical protein